MMRGVQHFFWRCFAELYEEQEEYYDQRDKRTKVIRKLESLSAEERLGLIEQAQKLKIKNAFFGDILASYKTFLKEEIGQHEKSVVDVLKDKVMVAKETEIVKRYKISDRIALIAKLRALMEQPEKFRQNDAIEKLLEEKNRKGDTVTYFEVVNMMIDYGMNEKAEKYATKIKDWDEQLFVLKFLATTSSVNTAVDQAISLKKFDDLVEIGAFVEHAALNPGKYPKIIVSDGLMQKIEKGLTNRR